MGGHQAPSRTRQVCKSLPHGHMKESGESLKGHIVCRAGAPEARPGETIGKSVTSVAEKTPEYWGHQNHALSVKGSSG